MNTVTITMDADEAAVKYDLYREALEGREPSDEDKGAMLGYKALADGKALLDLHQTLRECPVDDQGRPRLAVGRAHWEWCFFNAHPSVVRFAAVRNIYRGRDRLMEFPRSVLPPTVTDYKVWRAMVPMIPPNLRPARGLKNYVVLWEADWQAVPTDPILMRKLHGSLYVVLAQWDLTDLERAVLGARLENAPR